jgi:hypothetical protein
MMIKFTSRYLTEIIASVMMQFGWYQLGRKEHTSNTRGDPKITGIDLLRMRAF